MGIFFYYLKSLFSISFFKAFKFFVFADLSFFLILFFIILFIVFLIILFFLLALLKIFFKFFNSFLIFIKIFYYNCLNFFYKYFLFFVLDFFLFIYRLRFFFLIGSSYYDPLSKIFFENFSSMKGELLMDFYNFSNKFLFEEDFNVPLSVFSKIPLFESSKNAFHIKVLQVFFFHFLESHNRMRSFFFFNHFNNFSSFDTNFAKKKNYFLQRFDGHGSSKLIDFLFSIFSFRLNFLFENFFYFFELLEIYLLNLEGFFFLKIFIGKYFAFFKNSLIFILVNLENDSFINYLHVSLFRMAMQKYYNKNDWMNLINTYDFSATNSFAFNGDRSSDFFFFLKISFTYLFIYFNLILFLFFCFAFNFLFYLFYFLGYFGFLSNLRFVFLYNFSKFFYFLSLFSYFLIFYKKLNQYAFFYVFDKLKNLAHFFMPFFLFLNNFIFYILYFVIYFFRFMWSIFYIFIFKKIVFLSFFLADVSFSFLKSFFLEVSVLGFSEKQNYILLNIFPFLNKIRQKEKNSDDISIFFLTKEFFYLKLFAFYFGDKRSLKFLEYGSWFFFLRLFFFRFFCWFFFLAFIKFNNFDHKFLDLKYFVLKIDFFFKGKILKLFILLNVFLDYLFFWVFSCFFFVNIFIRKIVLNNYLFFFFYSLFRNSYYIFVISFYVIFLFFYYINLFIFLFLFLFLVYFFIFIFAISKILSIFLILFFLPIFLFLIKICFQLFAELKINYYFIYLSLVLKANFRFLLFYFNTLIFLKNRNLGFFQILSIFFLMRNDFKKYELIHFHHSPNLVSSVYVDFLLNNFFSKYNKTLFSLFENKNNTKQHLKENSSLISFINFSSFKSNVKNLYKNLNVLQDLNKKDRKKLKAIKIKNEMFSEFEYHKFLRSRDFRNLKIFRFKKSIEPSDLYFDPSLDNLASFDSKRNKFSNFDFFQFFYGDDKMFLKDLKYFRNVFSRRNLSFFYDNLDRLSIFRLRYLKLSPIFRYFYLKRERLKYLLTLHSFGNINSYSFSLVLNWILIYRILRSVLSLFFKYDYSLLVCLFPKPRFFSFHFLKIIDKVFFYYNYLFLTMIIIIAIWFVPDIFFCFCLVFILLYYYLFFLNLDSFLDSFYKTPFFINFITFFAYIFGFFLRFLHADFSNVFYFFQRIFFLNFGFFSRLIILFLSAFFFLYFYFLIPNIDFVFYFFSSVNFVIFFEDNVFIFFLLFDENVFCCFFFFLDFFNIIVYCLLFFILHSFVKFFFLKVVFFHFFNFEYWVLNYFFFYLNKWVNFDFFLSNQLICFVASHFLKEIDLLIEVSQKENKVIKNKFLKP